MKLLFTFKHISAAILLATVLLDTWYVKEEAEITPAYDD